MNRKYTKEEYFQKVESLGLSLYKSLGTLKTDFARFVLKFPRIYMYGKNNENSTGNDLYNCKNSQCCFNCRHLEDCKYMFDLGDNKTSMDCYEHGWLRPSELIYECHAGMAGYNFRFCSKSVY